MTQARRALDAGWDPDQPTEQYNAAAAENRAAEAELAAVPVEQPVTTDDVRAMLNQVGDIPTILNAADREKLSQLYRAGIAIEYDPEKRLAHVALNPAPERGVRWCPRGDLHLNPHHPLDPAH